jgi:hypothetical protein
MYDSCNSCKKSTEKLKNYERKILKSAMMIKYKLFLFSEASGKMIHKKNLKLKRVNVY